MRGSGRASMAGPWDRTTVYASCVIGFAPIRWFARKENIWAGRERGGSDLRVDMGRIAMHDGLEDSGPTGGHS